MTQEDPLLFHNSERVRASAMSGSERRLVVSFTGVGRRKGRQQPEEFVDAAQMAGRNHVLFVADRLRSWYNAPGMFEEIIDVAQSYARIHQIKDVMTVGEGMGGYGAILFAGALGASSSLSFSAQYSADPRVVPEDDRWMDYREKITHFTRPPLETVLSAECTYFAVHADNDRDKPHWSRFPKDAQVSHYLAGQADHALSRKMEAAGKLNAVVHCAILGRPVAFRRSLKSVFKNLAQMDNA